MEHYVGLDVSLKSTGICVVDAKGKIVREGVVITDPEAIAGFIALLRTRCDAVGPITALCYLGTHDRRSQPL